MKVLIIGHGCSPRLGSEPSFTWNWAWHLSRYHQVWVVAHPHDRQEVTRFLENYPNRNLRFHWVDVPQHLDPWDPRVPERGPRLHYLLWQYFAYKRAGELQKQIGFHIADQVSFGSVSAPPPVWRLPVPFVWGPVGGAQKSPLAFRGYFARTWIGEVARNTRIALLPVSGAVRKAARMSDVVLATNHETAELLCHLGAQDVRLFLDSGIPASFSACSPESKSKSGGIRLLWVGRMERRKALPLALEALEKTRDLGVKLLIAGDGPIRKEWEGLAKALNLEDRTEFLGHVPWTEMSRLYQSVDAFIFTSLRDSFGMQVLEAMAHGLPILTLNHQGVGTFVPAEAAIKVPVSDPEETVAGLVRGIRRLALFPEERLKMGEAAQAYAKTQTWENRAVEMSKIYEEVGKRAARRPSKHFFMARRGSPDIQSSALATFEVLGVRTHALQIPDVVAQMEEWIHKKTGCHSIAATSMHGIVQAQHDPEFKKILNSTHLVVPDGMPLVWLGRRCGHELRRRVYGPDLLLAFCESTAGRGYRHFFFGAERDPRVAERLAETLKNRFPEMVVAGTYSHPGQTVSREQDEEIVSVISRAAPDVLWVGLGELRQVRWMHEHRHKLSVPVLVGVGAAFDMLSGARRQAPAWMREHGLEWFFRLLQEPRRLWRRYLIYGAEFAGFLALERLRPLAFGKAGLRNPSPSVQSIPPGAVKEAGGK